MAHVLAHHKVSSYESWKKVFDEFAETRKASGELSYQILKQEKDSDDLYLMFEWDGADKAKAFMESPQLKEAMQKGGVTEAPEIHFLSEVAKGAL